MRLAMFAEALPGEKVRCRLCAHTCVIRNGKTGACGVRKNIGGSLYALNYGKLIAQHVDPIEKKPLYHFYPGSKTFSIATVGCNFRCAFCQNNRISQLPILEHRVPGEEATPSEIVEQAVFYGCKSIAYTYTEPTIFFEFMHDVARNARQAGLRNVIVSNGYLSDASLEFLAPHLDAANIDLKSMSERFYKTVCKGRLQPVLRTISRLKEMGVWLEVTTLIIPGLNDGLGELRAIAEFLAHLGTDVPWHVNAFSPAHKLAGHSPTSPATLYRVREIGRAAGLKYVYAGNIGDGEVETTYCHNCRHALLRRSRYRVRKRFLVESQCTRCGARIHGIGLG